MLFERSGSQFPNAKGHVFVELERQLLQRLDLGAELASVDRLRGERFEREPERGQLLPKLIVQFTCDSSALVFLRQDQACQQLQAFLFDPAPLGHLDAKRLIGH